MMLLFCFSKSNYMCKFLICHDRLRSECHTPERSVKDHYFFLFIYFLFLFYFIFFLMNLLNYIEEEIF